MTVHGESAVLVLAAGAGTRMRSDIPKVLHTLAGPQHAVARPARGGQGRPAAPRRGARPRPRTHHPGGRRTGRGTWAAPSTSRCRNSSYGTGHAVACGLAALPADFAGTVVVTSGDVPLLDADTLADLIATHSAETAAATVLTTTVPRSDRLRPDPAHPGRRGHRHRRGGRRHPVAAGDQRGQRRRLRLRHRSAALGARAGCDPTTPSRSST